MGAGVGVGVGVDGGSAPNLWAEPPLGPSAPAIAEPVVISSKTATPDVVVSTRMNKVAALISLRAVLCSMITP